MGDRKMVSIRMGADFVSICRIFLSPIFLSISYVLVAASVPPWDSAYLSVLGASALKSLVVAPAGLVVRQA